jgi:hypothetical protein
MRTQEPPSPRIGHLTKEYVAGIISGIGLGILLVLVWNDYFPLEQVGLKPHQYQLTFIATFFICAGRLWAGAILKQKISQNKTDEQKRHLAP